MPKAATKNEQNTNLAADASVKLFSGPGAISVEAAIADEDKPRLPRFSMVAYTGGAMRIAGWR